MGASSYHCSGEITPWLLAWLQLKENCALLCACELSLFRDNDIFYNTKECKPVDMSPVPCTSRNWEAPIGLPPLAYTSCSSAMAARLWHPCLPHLAVS